VLVDQQFDPLNSHFEEQALPHAVFSSNETQKPKHTPFQQQSMQMEGFDMIQVNVYGLANHACF